jgi:phage terminase small subunit
MAGGFPGLEGSSKSRVLPQKTAPAIWEEMLFCAHMEQLTAKQAAFVREYLLDLNATQAAIRAGYSPRTAYSIGQENLKKPEIARAIETAMEERSKRTEITQDYVLDTIRDTIELCRGLSPVTDKAGNPVIVTTKRGQEAALCAFRPLAVLRGAELLGKHLKMWTDRIEAKHDASDSLVERIREGRERVLRGMSDDELNAKIQELETELGYRKPKINIEFKEPSPTRQLA